MKNMINRKTTRDWRVIPVDAFNVPITLPKGTDILDMRGTAQPAPATAVDWLVRVSDLNVVQEIWVQCCDPRGLPGTEAKPQRRVPPPKRTEPSKQSLNAVKNIDTRTAEYGIGVRKNYSGYVNLLAVLPQHLCARITADNAPRLERAIVAFQAAVLDALDVEEGE